MAAPWASLLVPTPLLTRGQPHGTPRTTALPRILSPKHGGPIAVQILQHQRALDPYLQ